ncbi:MAG: hypothetical protein P8Y05_05710 [Deinococcales bacterium]
MAGCEVIITTAPEELHAHYDYFTVVRYDVASVDLYGLTTGQDLGTLIIDASCAEDDFPWSMTHLTGSTVLYAGDVRHVTLWYAAGDLYFGYAPVWCSFYGETTSGREVIIRPY